MIQFEATIEQYGQNGEKSGWTYILIPEPLAQELNPGVRKGYRVKGQLDQCLIKNVALMPIGAGDFIMPLNAAMRKSLGKKKGAQLLVTLRLDHEEYQLNNILTSCIKESACASAVFFALPRSHQNYYSKWVESAKTTATQEKRIAQIVVSLERGQDFGTMLREQSAQKKG